MASPELLTTRIAVVKPCCIGDCVMALPALQALRTGYPDSHIDVWVGGHSRAVFDMAAAADSVVEFPNQPGLRSVPSLAAAWRRASYDTVIILDRSRALHVAVKASGARRIAATTFRAAEQRHESDVYLSVVRYLVDSAPATLPIVIPSDAARESATDRITSHAPPTVVLHPGGAQNPGVNMLDKRWQVERWSELTCTLVGNGCQVLLSGGPADRAVALRVASLANLPTRNVIAGEFDISGTAAIVARAALFVGIDTGMSHVAAAVGTPTVAIFGPTNPRRYRPLGPHVRVVSPDESWMVPDADLRRTHAQPTRPTTADVLVSDVLFAAESLLRSSRISRII